MREKRATDSDKLDKGGHGVNGHGWSHHRLSPFHDKQTVGIESLRGAPVQPFVLQLKSLREIKCSRTRIQIPVCRAKRGVPYSKMGLHIHPASSIKPLRGRMMPE